MNKKGLETQKAISSLKALQKAGSQLFIFCLCLSLFSCGGGGNPTQNIVRDVKVSTSLENDDFMIDIKLLMDLGNMTLTSIQIPVTNPDNGVNYGKVSFMPTLDGLNEIGLSVNLSDSANLPGGEARLPNDSVLPIGGLEGTQVLQLEVEQIHSRIYLALQEETVFLGMAVAIDEFDVLSRYIGGANIFFGHEFRGVRGSVGLFAGTGQNESGLAFFLDLSKVISPAVIRDIINQQKIDESSLAQIQALVGKATSQGKSKLKFNVNKSKKKLRNLGKFLYKMDRKKAQLNISHK